MLYARGLHNSDLAQALKNLPKKLTIADSAEPKSISEIARYGVPILGTPKGRDSKRFGIQAVQNQRISMTRRSVDLIREYRNYLLAQDKEGRFIPGETVGADDCLDAARYGICSLVPVIQGRELAQNMPRLERKPIKNPAR